MSIEFDTLEGSLEGSLDLTLPAPSVVITPVAYTAMRAELSTVLATFVGEVSLATPTYVGVDATGPHVVVDMSGFVSATGELDLTLDAPAAAFYDGARVDMLLPAPTAYLTDAYPGYALIDLHLDALLAGEYGAAELTDEYSFTDEYESEWAVVLQEILGVSDSLTLLAKVAGTITDSVVARDYVAAIFMALLEDEAEFEATELPNLRLIIMVADQLMMEDAGISHLSALVTVAAAFLIGDAVVAGRDLTLDDELRFLVDDELEAKLKAVVELLDELEMEAELVPSLSLLAMLDDMVQLEGTPLGLLSLLAEIMDEVTFTVRLNTPDGDTFIGYAMNIRNGAVTEYDNYPFNSFAVVGGRPYGASAEGVFRLEGDDDAGDPIAALVRTGILNFESLTKVPNGWIMLKSDGEMMMKTVVMDGGQKKENWYKMKARPEGEPVESRFDIAKGLTGTYWQWELANMDGAYFELDVVKVWPLRLQRRYSGR